MTNLKQKIKDLDADKNQLNQEISTLQIEIKNQEQNINTKAKEINFYREKIVNYNTTRDIVALIHSLNLFDPDAVKEGDEVGNLKVLILMEILKFQVI